MSVKLVVCAYSETINAMRNWLTETPGRYWLTGHKSLGIYEQWYLTFLRDADGMEFYLTWHEAQPDCWVDQRYCG